MGNELKQKLASLVRAEKLTLSGEMIIQKKAVEIVTLQEVYESGLNDNIAALKQLCPAIKSGFFVGVCDVTVKFFVYQKTFEEDDFYNRLSLLLEQGLARLESTGLYNTRLNVTGTIDKPATSERFRYMNKGAAVSYKITATDAHFDIFKNLRRAICNQLK